MLNNPLLLEIPETLESERLIIRAIRAEDAAAAHAAVRESIGTLSRWMAWAADAYEQSREDALTYVREARAQFIKREELNYFVWHKVNGEFAGALGVHHIDWTVPRFEIGYWLRSGYEGQGYMSEAVNRLTRFLFEDLGAQRIEIRCDAENKRSAGVAERTGFTLEGRLRHERRSVANGGLADTLVYARMREDWHDA